MARKAPDYQSIDQPVFQKVRLSKTRKIDTKNKKQIKPIIIVLLVLVLFLLLLGVVFLAKTIGNFDKNNQNNSEKITPSPTAMPKENIGKYGTIRKEIQSGLVQLESQDPIQDHLIPPVVDLEIGLE